MMDLSGMLAKSPQMQAFLAQVNALLATVERIEKMQIDNSVRLARIEASMKKEATL